jgi:hypothetical protein
VRCATLLVALAAPVAAGAFSLEWPVGCIPGEDCYIQQYADHNPGPGARDFLCGTLSYDGHDGTDVALPTLADMARGVPVLAAAAGEVTGVRDGMPDVVMTDPAAPDLAGRDCGNGVVLRHTDGWETQYCHLRQGSVAVVPGERVEVGDVLGMVGLSGMTEFPHLHLSVRREGVAVDPFAPAGTPACGTVPATLWADPPQTPPGGILANGFSDRVPDYAAIKGGDPFPPPGRESALVLWGYLFGGRRGDIMEITISGPAGEVIDHTALIVETQALFFRAAGRRAPDGGWPIGDYEGTIRLERGGKTIDAASLSVTIGD